MRAKPFSGKKKKQQLQEKRHRKQEKVDDDVVEVVSSVKTPQPKGKYDPSYVSCA